MKRKPPIPHQLFSRTLLSCAAAAALLPQGAWALDLAQSPPGTKEPYVAPNVIISIDDSGSMNFRLDMESASGASSQTEPNSDGTWPMTSRRVNVLKYALVGKNGSGRSEEHTSELQSPCNLVCRLLLEKKNTLTIFCRS